MVLPWQLHELGALDMLGHVAAMGNWHVTVLGPMQDEGRGPDRSQDGANVAVVGHTQEGHRGPGACRGAGVVPTTPASVDRPCGLPDGTEHHARSPLSVNTIEQLVAYLGR